MNSGMQMGVDGLKTPVIVVLRTHQDVERHINQGALIPVTHVTVTWRWLRGVKLIKGKFTLNKRLKKEKKMGAKDTVMNPEQIEKLSEKTTNRRLVDVVAEKQAEITGKIMKQEGIKEVVGRIQENSHFLEGDKDGLDNYDVEIGDRIIPKKAWQDFLKSKNGE